MFIVHRNFTKFLSGLIQVRKLQVIMSAAPVFFFTVFPARLNQVHKLC
jgi:hypothetical protein